MSKLFNNFNHIWRTPFPPKPSFVVLCPQPRRSGNYGLFWRGQGALRLAFKYPALFSSVEGMSGAVDDNASNVAVNEPQLLAAMFNGDANAFDVQTANG